MTKRKTTVSPEKQTLKPPPSTGDVFADSCFVLDSLPALDDRIGSQMEGLKDVPGLVKQGLLEDAWMILDTHHLGLKDLDFIYAFKALILQKNGQPDAAKKTLLAGLKFGQGKFLLYERLGFLSFETGQLSEAVKWWIKSIVAMKMLNQVSMWEPFLYLAGVAKALSSETHFRILMAWVNEISPHGELSLDDKTLKMLNEQARDLSSTSTLKAVDALCLHYLHKPDNNQNQAFPGNHPTGYPNVPAARGHLFAPNSLFGEDKRKVWITRLAVIIIVLVLLLFFLQFLKSSEQEPDTSVPQVSIKPTVVEPEKENSVEPEKEKSVEPATDPVRNKGKYPFLKMKAKDPRSDIKPKE